MTREFLTVLALTLLMLAEGCDPKRCECWVTPKDPMPGYLICPGKDVLEWCHTCLCPEPAASGSAKP